MKLSIFKEARAHPRSKAEKVKESFKVSKPYLPTTITIHDDNALIEAITSYAWSPFVFDGPRHATNFVSCDFLVYDIDEGLTIDEADAILLKAGHCYLILPSPSHKPEAHRFRVVLPLAHSIFDFETYDATWLAGAKLLGVVDEQCKDKARYYFGSTTEDGISDFSGELFHPVKAVESLSRGYIPSQSKMINVTSDKKDIIAQIYGEEREQVSEAVDYFITNAPTGIPGSWINSLNAAAFSLALSGVSEDVIIEVFSKLAPEGELDSRDLYQVNKAVRDGSLLKD